MKLRMIILLLNEYDCSNKAKVEMKQAYYTFGFQNHFHFFNVVTEPTYTSLQKNKANQQTPG